MCETKDLQNRLLEMLIFFHEYCEHNDLTYYALGGTLLGAVRHKGFIPWDDDIDVGMPRKDFQKLIDLMSSESNSFYVIEGPQSKDASFLYPYAKLYDSRTTLVENTRNQLVRGIFIDIFPLDGLANDYDLAKKKYKSLQRLRNRLILRNLSNNKKRTWYKRMIIKLVQMIPLSSFNEKNLCLRIDRFCRECNSIDDCKYGGNLLGAWGFKEVMETRILNERELYSFENAYIYGVKDYDEYLTSLYGDWRTLPPIEKRVTHHDYYLDLNKPYSEYLLNEKKSCSTDS